MHAAEVGRQSYDGTALERSAAKFANADNHGDEHVCGKPAALRRGAARTRARLSANTDLREGRKRKKETTQQEESSTEKPGLSEPASRDCHVAHPKHNETYPI